MHSKFFNHVGLQGFLVMNSSLNGKLMLTWNILRISKLKTRKIYTTNYSLVEKYTPAISHIRNIQVNMLSAHTESGSFPCTGCICMQLYVMHGI